MAIYPIDDDGSELPGRFELEPRDLYRKHGFADGTMFWETTEWLREHEHLAVDPRQLLGAVVIEHLLPRLNPEPLTDEIGGPYNPVRAISADGDLLARSMAPASWPEVVAVHRRLVLELGRELGEPMSNLHRRERSNWWDFDAA